MAKDLESEIDFLNTKLSKLAKENNIPEYEIVMDKKLKIAKELRNLQDDY
jgi:hypothetical protein